LPPHSDSESGFLYIENSSIQHNLRHNALNALTLNSANRIAICSLWNFTDNDNDSRGMYVHAKVQVFDNKLMICGSSNINARSYTTDTELSCAVYDQTLIRNYYDDIWNYLFAKPIPLNIDFNMPGWGKVFFEEFNKLVTKDNNLPISNVIYDPWNNETVTLPNRQKRNNSSQGLNKGASINNPIGFNEKIRNDVKDDKGKTIRQVRLDDIVNRLETNEDSVWRVPP